MDDQAPVARDRTRLVAGQMGTMGDRVQPRRQRRGLYVMMGSEDRPLMGTRLLAVMALFLVALVWGVSFVPVRTAMQHVGPLTFAGLRFALASLCLIPIVAWRNHRPGGLGSQVTADAPMSPWRGRLLLGTLLFGGTSLQQIGIVDTSAGKAGLITGLYIVFVPLLLALLWRRRVAGRAWLATGLATVGLCLLSLQADFRLAPGDSWVLAGAVVWALHVIFVGRLAGEQDPIQLSLAQCSVCALLCLAFAFGLESWSWDGLRSSWTEIAYTGVGAVAAGFTIQAVAQRHVPPTHAAIILSLEAVFAALAGWLMLGETMTPRMLVGTGLMLSGILVAQTDAGARL